MTFEMTADNPYVKIVRVNDDGKEQAVVINFDDIFHFTTAKHMEKVEVGNLKAGDHFRYVNHEWVVLDPEHLEKPSFLGPGEFGVFCIMANTWKSMEFGDSNNYRDSEIVSDLANLYLDEQFKRADIITHWMDLTADNGDKKYGCYATDLFILSCDEYRKYRDYIPHYETMWTCTPWGCGESIKGYVRYASALGALNISNALYYHGVFPACILRKNVLVEKIKEV